MPSWSAPPVEDHKSYMHNLTRLLTAYNTAWGQVYLSAGPRAGSGEDGLCVLPPRITQVVKWAEEGGWEGYEVEMR